MGLFTSRRGRGVSPGAQTATPVRVSLKDGDFERCDAALRRFEAADASGQASAIRSALLGVAQAGGWRGDLWALEEQAAGRDVHTQAWRWLALVAEAASTSNPALAGRVGWFFKVFSEKIGPNMHLVDYFDFALEQPPEEVYRAALVSAITGLGAASPELVVLEHGGRHFDADDMIVLLGRSLSQLRDAGSPGEAQARAIVSRPVHPKRPHVPRALDEGADTLDVCARNVQKAERLAAEQPDRDDYKRKLAVSYSSLGAAHQALRNTDEALDSYTRSLRIAQRLAAEEPDHDAYQRNVAVAHNELGDAQRALGRPNDALDSYTRGLRIMQRLAAEDPNRVDYQRKLAAAHTDLGRITASMGDMAAARGHFHADLRIARRVLVLQPESPTATVDLAESLVQVASVSDPHRHAREAAAVLEHLRTQGRLNKRGAAVLAQLQ
jgi:tetratricopeptide (TPR) repeat protein